MKLTPRGGQHAGASPLDPHFYENVKGAPDDDSRPGSREGEGLPDTHDAPVAKIVIQYDSS
jgi:hypothetical protein